jgi:hypothetical protein
MAQQYYYPVSYLTTFRSVPQLLFGEHVTDLDRSADGTELHVDRALDIEFSGIVFNRTCREPFLEVVLPIFDQEPPENQPTSVVDTGSGDGTLLVELYHAIRRHTARGKVLDQYPLLMIGAEYNRVAQEATAARLHAEKVPHLTVFGDIGDPHSLAEALSSRSVDPHEVLHVSKSVIHNRVYAPPRNSVPMRDWQPSSSAVFVTPKGDLISARDLERNLVQHFRTWLPWTRKHGMVVIEAHTVDPEIVAPCVGRNILTYLDASHGYSHQYLVEAEVFRRCAQAAGFRSLTQRDLAVQMVGQPVLTIDRFVS